MQQDNSSFWTDIKTVEEQLEKSPDSFCFARLSELYLKVGLVDDALYTARRGGAKYPAYLAGQRALAFACRAKGLNDDCLASLKLLTAAIPEDREALKLMAKLEADAGDYAAARRALQVVLEFFPDDAESREEFESFEFAFTSPHSSFYMDEDDEEDILEEIEIIEELDVFEEDQVEDQVEEKVEEEEKEEVEEKEEEEEKVEVEVELPPVEVSHDPLSTGTLAELYVKQGFIHKALEIYQAILLDAPGNIAVATRIAELEQLDAPAAESPAPDDDTLEHDYDEYPDTDTEEDISVPCNVFSDTAEPVNPFETPVEEKIFFPELPQAPLEMVKKEGIADNALSTLEGWLENIRRVKSCR